MIDINDGTLAKCEEVNSNVIRERIEVIQEKISDCPEAERIQLDKDTIYHFSCTLDNEMLKLKLSEIGAFSPYIYECLLSLEEIKKRYKMFRGCKDL